MDRSSSTPPPSNTLAFPAYDNHHNISTLTLQRRAPTPPGERSSRSGSSSSPSRRKSNKKKGRSRSGSRRRLLAQEQEDHAIIHHGGGHGAMQVQEVETIPDDYYYDDNDTRSVVDQDQEIIQDDYFDQSTSVDPRMGPSPNMIRRHSRTSLLPIPRSSRPNNNGELLIRPDDIVLSPRADVWIYLSASSFVGVASLARAHAEYARLFMKSNEKMGAYVATIIALLSINATISLIMGLAYRYRPFMMALTRPLGDRRSSACSISPELLLVVVTLLFWMICMIFYNTPNDMAFQIISTGMPLSQQPNNGNFFYSLWISGILSMYLISHLCIGYNQLGVMSITGMMTPHQFRKESIARIWMLLFFASVLLLSFSMSLRAGPLCNGPLVGDSPYCASSTVSLITSILGMMACISCMVTRFLAVSALVKIMIERFLALSILIAYACNAGIVTGPGGSGANIGNVYVSSWYSLILALMLSVNYIGLHFMMGMSKREELDMMRKNSINENDDDVCFGNIDGSGHTSFTSRERSESPRSRNII